MAFFAKLGALFAVPFLMVSGFFGVGGHMASTTPSHPIVTASTTASTTIGTWKGSHPHIVPPHMTPHTASSTAAIGTDAITLSPVDANVGDTVTITGNGFTTASVVHFAVGVVSNTSVSSDGTKISFTVPSSIGPDCSGGKICPMYVMLVTPRAYDVYVETGNVKTATAELTVTGSSTMPTSMTVHNQTMINASL